MTNRHVDLVIIAAVLSAILGGVQLALGNAAQTPYVTAGLAFIAIILPALKALYTRSPNEADPLGGLSSAYLDALKQIAVTVVSSMLTPKTPPAVPAAPVLRPPAAVPWSGPGAAEVPAAEAPSGAAPSAAPAAPLTEEQLKARTAALEAQVAALQAKLAASSAHAT